MAEESIPKLYSVNDACKALGGMSRSTFYGLVRAGLITTVKLGKRTFVTDRALEDFVNGLESSSLKLTDRQIRALRRRQLKK